MKILSIPYTHTLSHISRPLLVAKELKSRGHEVVFAGESPKTKFIKDEGYEVLPVHEPDPEVLFGNIRKGKLRFVSDSEVEKMIEADLALYKEVKPDIVLTDGRFSSPISTHIAGLKHVAIVNVSSTEYRALPYIPFFDWLPGFTHKVLDGVNLKIEMLIFDNAMSVFKRLSKKYGIKNTVTATSCLTGKDITLLADIPEYFPTKNLPDNYRYIGPLTWKTDILPPKWWPPKGKRPLVYVTMGTTGIGDFFGKAYRLFEASEFSAVITTGAQASGLRRIENKVYVEPFMDGDLVMEECDLVVCHGGNGTIYQALGHGKPIIGIPAIADQRFNMRRVEALGVGKTLSWKDFESNPSSLMGLIKTIVNDKSYYNNASRLKEIIGGYNAPKTAANIICSLFKQKV